MNTKTYNKFKALLTKACDKRVKAGKPIASGGFRTDKGCCPIACVVGPYANDDYFDRMNKKLGTNVDEAQYWSFIEGFDGGSDPRYSATQLFKLGRSLRKKYLNK